MSEQHTEALAWVEDALAKALSQTSEIYTYEDEEVYPSEIAAADGLLPLVIENVQALHRALGINERFLAGLEVVQDDDGLLNRRVILTKALHNPSIVALAVTDRLRMLREMNNAATRIKLEWLERPAQMDDIDAFLLVAEKYIRQSERPN